MYVDESGDHSLTTIDPRYPVFVLSFCIFRKEVYTDIVAPKLRHLKFSIFGHDMVIFHEHDIRKREGSFKLFNKETREKLLNQLTLLIENLNFIIIAIVIEKSQFRNSDLLSSYSVYHYAMQLGLERIYQFFQSENQHGKLTHMVFESRGKTEDQALANEFLRVCDRKNVFSENLPFNLVVADKKTNSEGLQLADMTARPIGLAVLRPQQPNRTLEILKKKIYYLESYGFNVNAVESERLQGILGA